MGQGVQAVQEAGAVVVICEDESVVTVEEVDAEIGAATDIDDDVQIYGRWMTNSGPGNGGPPAGLKMAVAAVAENEEAADSMQTKRVEACSCYPVARTLEGATLKGMVEEDR